MGQKTKCDGSFGLIVASLPRKPDDELLKIGLSNPNESRLLRDPRRRMSKRSPYGERVRRGSLLEKLLGRNYPNVRREGSTLATWAEFINHYLGALAQCAGKLDGSERGTPVRQMAVHYFATNLVFEAPEVDRSGAQIEALIYEVPQFTGRLRRHQRAFLDAVAKSDSWSRLVDPDDAKNQLRFDKSLERRRFSAQAPRGRSRDLVRDCVGIAWWLFVNDSMNSDRFGSVAGAAKLLEPVVAGLVRLARQFRESARDGRFRESDL